MQISIEAFKLAAPFSSTDLALSTTFTAELNDALQTIEGLVAAPLPACITLWIIIQGILVMRGDLDTRRGLTKIIMVSIVAGLVTSSSLYDSYVQTFFEQTIPGLVSDVNEVDPIPLSVPLQLDGVFVVTENLFQLVAARIGPDNVQATFAFEGAHLVFLGSLWTVFGIYDIVNIMTETLVAIGPLILIGYLFDATRNMTIRWVWQLAYYGLLLLLLNIVATLVIELDAAFSVAASIAILAIGPTGAKVIGLDELDMFFLTGDALVVALPTIAAVLTGGAADSAGSYASQLVQRRLMITPTGGRQGNSGSAEGKSSSSEASPPPYSPPSKPPPPYSPPSIPPPPYSPTSK
jgi:type IV secretion system protein VirB6